jgi:long-chain acyl-CoA synthetase
MTGAHPRRRWLQSYPSWVPPTLPLPTESLIDRFEASVRRRPAAPAVFYFDRTITFAELDAYACRFAADLEHRGIGPGDRVALFLQNVPQFFIAVFGAWKRGAIVVPLNPMFKQQELAFHLTDSGAKVLVCLEQLYDSCAVSVIGGTAVEHLFTTNESDFLTKSSAASMPALQAARKHRASDGVDFLDAIGRHDVSGSARRSVHPSDVCCLSYTSGTTGTPKGAMGTHGNFLYNAEVYRTWMRLNDDDCVLGAAPLFHITGMVAHLATAAAAAIPVVLFYKFEAAQVFQMIDRWRPTMTVAAITAFVALKNHPAAPHHDLTCLQRCYSGGAPIAPATTDAFEQQFGVYIHNVYGMTESSSPTHAVPLGLRAPVDADSGALSVGVPVPGCDARIVDLEDPSREVGIGEQGELAVRGPMMFAGYWNRPEATSRAFVDGYYLTGDVLTSDERGFFYVVDRKKDVIIASGFKIWPREVEDVLYQHPAVKEAAVVGIPDEYRGETVKAFVAVNAGFESTTERDLIEHCRQRLAAYKYPRVIALVDELPKTSTGKFLRRELRARSMTVGADNTGDKTG